MDIDIKNDNKRFNARASAIIYNKDKTKILLFKIKDRDFYMLPGGRINYFEDSESAIKREIKEELGLDLNFDFCSVQEVFLNRNDKQIMQYCFCYKSVFKGEAKDDKINSLDEKNQYFYWIDINKLNEYNIFPKSNLELVDKDIAHLIDKENSHE